MTEGAKTEKKQRITVKKDLKGEKGCCQYDGCVKNKRGDATHTLAYTIKRGDALVGKCCSEECAQALKELVAQEPPINKMSRNGGGPRNGARVRRDVIVNPGDLPPERTKLRPLLKNGRVRTHY